MVSHCLYESGFSRYVLTFSLLFWKVFPRQNEKAVHLLTLPFFAFSSSNSVLNLPHRRLGKGKRIRWNLGLALNYVYVYNNNMYDTKECAVSKVDLTDLIRWIYYVAGQCFLTN